MTLAANPHGVIADTVCSSNPLYDTVGKIVGGGMS